MISIKSHLLKVSLLPEFGAQIVSLQDSDNNEYLAPGLIPRPAALPLSATFNEGGLGGIDECLPAIAPGTYPVEPYRDWLIPDHGEVWLRPWQIESVTDDSVTLSVKGDKLPYTFTRRLNIVGHELHFNYVLENHGAVALPIVWALHPMFQPTPQLQIDIGQPDALLVEASNANLRAGSTIPYPLVPIGDQTVDLRRWRELPMGFYLKAFAPPESGSRLRLIYPEWSTTLEIFTQARQPLHIGLWLNRGGFPEDSPVEHFSIEPTFGSSDSLDKAFGNNSCLMLKARSSENWSVVYRLVPLENMV